MSQTVSLWGATYSDVPKIEVPSSSGTVKFTDVTDTTAVAADVAQGKYFYLASGEKVAGTGSGGGTGGITQDANGYLVLDDEPGGGGGGATNCVCGTFTTSSTTGAAQTITIPYTGSGFPMTCNIYLPEGYSNPEGTVYNTVHHYGVVTFMFMKYDNVAPTYESNDSDRAQRWTRYKTSDSDATLYSTSSSGTAVFSASAASSSASYCARFNSSTQLSVYVSASGDYGLIPSTEYAYCIGYSS